MSERKFPIQGTEDGVGRVSIPWEWAEIAYEEYAARWGTAQSLERLAERHGFGVSEVIELLVGKIKRNTRPASPALDRLKELVEGAPHVASCGVYGTGSSIRPRGPFRPCDCFRGRALRIIEELKQ